MLAKNMLTRIEITDLNNLGFGVGRVEGKVVFVGGAVDGDVVEARIIRVNAGYAIARMERLLAPSPYRAPSPCAAKGCGGCAYLSVNAEHEAALKVAAVRASFTKHGMGDAVIEPLLSAGERYHYRNKAQYPVAPDPKGGCCIGFYAPKSHRVVAAEDCPLGAPVFSPILHELHRLIDLYAIPAYDEETGKGLLRHIYLRAGKVSGEILLTLVVNGRALPHAGEIVSALREKFPAIVGILLNVNTADTNVICGEEYIPLWGKDTLTDILCGVKLEIAPAAFYQVNHDAAELLYHRARELADLRGDEILLDLFCGAGSIGLSMADGVREVIGIEIVEDAVACAKRNAAANGIENASFYCGDAEECDKLLARAEAERGSAIRPDVVVLDPPRRGCGADLLIYIADHLAPSRVVYISCNPDTLARDAVTLQNHGYQMGAVTPVDLFPCTGHVESVVCFSRQIQVHNMKLHSSPFEMIKSGQKTIELRLFDEKRQQIKIGDQIVFTNTTTGETLNATVVKLHYFNSFEELYKSLPLLKCGYTAENVDKAHPSDMEQYYSVEEQDKYGIVGIELFILSKGTYRK